MWPPSIVVTGPLTEGPPQMRCVQWDEIVHAFASYASNQPFTMSVGGGHTNRGSQYADTPAFARLIQTGRERLVSIVQKKLVVLIARKRLPQLLQSPLRSRMLGDIEVEQTPRSDLEGNEYIKDTEAYRHGNEEIASDNSTCMVPDEGGPPLVLAAVRTWRLLDVLPNRTW